MNELGLKIKQLDALLDCFEQNNYSPVTPLESFTNISNNLINIEIRSNEEITLNKLSYDCRTGVGLLITTDGWFITAAHILGEDLFVLEESKKPDLVRELELAHLEDRLLERFVIVNQIRKEYNIIPGSCSYSLEDDLALLKADIYTPDPRPVRFNIRETPLKRKESIQLLGFQHGARVNHHGQITVPRTIIAVESERIEAFETDAYSVEGLSGGIYVDSAARLVGLNILGNVAEGEKVGEGGGIHADKLIKLIEQRRLQESEKLGFM